MPQLNISQIPTVAVDFMNHDHGEATELLNALLAKIDALRNGEDVQADISQQLGHIYQHSEEHFAREEAEMLRVNFPPYGCHKGEHDRVLNELIGVSEQWQNTKDADALTHYLNHVFTPWFINHISTMDTVTAYFISDQS